MKSRTSAWIWDAVTSLKLTIACLAALMVLVVANTLAQVDLGTFGATERFMRPWFVTWDVPGTSLRIPIFPGGALVGTVLMVNLIAAQGRRLELSWRKAGLWITHAGLILLFVGEFVSGALQVETQLAVEEGQTVDFVEAQRELELAVIDVTDPAHDDVWSVPERRLARGGTVDLPGAPVQVRVVRYFRNAALTMRTPADPPGPVTAGVGAAVAVRELPPVARDDMQNRGAAFVEPVVGGQGLGTFLVSNALGAPQAFEAGGRTWQILMRNRREYLPYSVTLKDFRHDVYAGTTIPKNFSSLVHLVNPSTGENRDVLIYMNQPLRYEGKTFYQSSFGKDDTLSILQVVENPGWLLPYVSTALVTLGLLVHFGITLRRSQRRRQVAAAPGAQPAEA
ncbi:MAG TPA: cytochrome c biogenesis protein ResB [Anaeromyxobacteraceae bacterium]|nr:cytochrome c biogenesis protein ResB [Anaeromyxobacteraceae bacterium]